MSECFRIKGRKRLEGKVKVSGAKNSAGSILAATLLTGGECVVGNLPRVNDVFNLIAILKSLGAEVGWEDDHKVRIKAENIDPEKMDLSLVGKSRVSVLLIGSLLSRVGRFRFAPPGGDRIGLRPITTHLKALGELGLEVEREGGRYVFDGGNLEAGEVILREFSVTATEVLMMAAAGLPGKTVVKTAAAEPHVRHLGEMLQKMGVEIKGIGTHRLEIEGRKDLGGVEIDVLSDHVEAGTLFLAGALTPGEMTLESVNLSDLDFFLAKMKDMKVSFEKGEGEVTVGSSGDLKPVDFQALPWPGFPTDILPIVVPLLTQASGKSLIHDPLYENRLNYVQELRKMGADIEVVDPHRAIVFGKTPLFGIEISSWDIRAGASLVIAALAAEGESVINNVYQIDRGYEDFDGKLRSLGADIKRIKKD